MDNTTGRSTASALAGNAATAATSATAAVSPGQLGAPGQRPIDSPTQTTVADKIGAFPPGWLYVASLCAASGIADAVGFIQSGVFAANMTGNTVLVGLSLADGNWITALSRSLTLVTFFAGAIIGRALLRAAHGRTWLALTVEAALLVACAFVDPKGALSIWLVAAAMGLQSTGMTRFGTISISTVVVTSTLSRLAEFAVDSIVPRRKPANTGAAVVAPGLLASAWFCYGLGAMVGALLMRVTDYVLLVSAVIVLMVGLLSSRRKRVAG